MVHPKIICHLLTLVTLIMSAQSARVSGWEAAVDIAAQTEVLASFFVFNSVFLFNLFCFILEHVGTGFIP